MKYFEQGNKNIVILVIQYATIMRWTQNSTPRPPFILIEFCYNYTFKLTFSKCVCMYDGNAPPPRPMTRHLALWKNPSAPIMTEWWLQAKNELSMDFFESLPEKHKKFFIQSIIFNIPFLYRLRKKALLHSNIPFVTTITNLRRWFSILTESVSDYWRIRAFGRFLRWRIRLRRQILRTFDSFLGNVPDEDQHRHLPRPGKGRGPE